MKTLTAIGSTAVLALSLSACDIDQTQEGELPDVDISATEGQIPKYDVEITKTQEGKMPDIDVDADAGTLPRYDVDVADVDLGTREVDVKVPDVDVDVDMERTQVSIPTIDVDMPDDDERYENDERNLKEEDSDS